MINLVDYRSISVIDYSNDIALLVTQNDNFSLLPDMIKFDALRLPDSVYNFITANNSEEFDGTVKGVIDNVVTYSRLNVVCYTLDVLATKSEDIYIIFDNYPLYYLECLKVLFDDNNMNCRIFKESL